MAMKTVERALLDALFEALKRRGFTLLGPTVSDHAIVYGNLDSTQDLPVGYTDEQDGGTYRLRKRDDDALFGYVVGPHSWKRFLLPPELRLWSASKAGNVFDISPPDPEKQFKYAFIGVRSCELHAIAAQDRVFMQGAFLDSHYKQRRQGVFIVAVNCGGAGGTCFCTSMNTGPRVTSGFDLALTEVIEGERHYFVVEPGSDRGAEVLEEIAGRPASQHEIAKAEETTKVAEGQIRRSLDTDGIKDLLYRNLDNPWWDDVAQRCLTCGNCTLVCPTCFCTTVEDTTDLSGERVERWRRWDSCFTSEFSFIHGGNIRSSSKSRYRQWLTHKLASWIEQFGSSGCVGCGRCITWCPVGIDITEEVRAIRASDREASQKGSLPAD
jgi:sulfhydrogenase subunit beta (sulfur reductase)